MMYENILNIMLKTRINEFDIEDIRSEIIKQIPINYNTSLPNIMILESSDTPNCNENACEIYHNDLPRSSDSYLYIACDQAIFERLISYKEIHKDTRLLLGQWHTSKDMCSTLITIFSEYRIFNLAATLSVRYLDKLEYIIDY